VDNVFSILIVEDNPDIAANIGDFLADQGHVADFASDGVMEVD
jgi:DNA-binding response OmpR family regulator